MAIAIEEIQLQDFKKRFILQDFKVLKLNLPFDLGTAKEILHEVLRNYSLKSKDEYVKYKGICLHYRDDEDPLYDGLNQVAYIDKNQNIQIKRKHGLFTNKNKIGHKFEFIEDLFPFLKLGRGRILAAEPGFKMSEHCDGPFAYTLHFPLVSSVGASLFIDGEKFHLAADGSCYLVNAELPHYIENNSTQDRVHIVYSLSPLNFRELSEADLICFQKYFNFIIKNYILAQAPWISFIK